MKNHENIFRYIGITAIVLLIFGLGGWYLFLRNQTAVVESASNARGFSIGIPAFLGSRGSTAALTESGITGETNPSGNSGVGSFSTELGMGGVLNDSFSTTESAEGAAMSQKPPRLWRVSNIPVAGASFTSSSSPNLRYVERSTGHLFDANPMTGDVRRQTNKLMPKIYEAFIGPRDTVIERGLEAPEMVRTRAGQIGTTTENGALLLTTREIVLPLDAIATSRSTSDILMLVATNPGSRLIRSLWDGSAPKQLAIIQAGDFAIRWPSESRIILLEKPASGIMGAAFTVGSSLIPLARGPGLMVLPHGTSSAFLFSTDSGNALTLFAQLPNATTLTLPLQTIAEKCAWAPGNDLVAYCAVPTTVPGTNFIDQWFSGETHTEDAWYRVQVSAGTAEKLYSIDGAAIDVEHAMVDDTGEYLAFTNARDKSLWVLRIQDK